MQEIDDKNLQSYKSTKKKMKDVKKINPLTPPLLIYLVRNNNFLLTKLSKKPKTTKEVFDTIVNKDWVKAKTPIEQVLTLLSKKKKKTSLLSNTFFIKKKAITPTNIFKKKTKSQKTGMSLADFHTGDCN